MKILPFILIIAALQIQFCSAYIARALVKPEDGKCPYEGHLITPGESVASIDPCERFTCSAYSEDEYEVEIAGCISRGLSGEDAKRCHFEAGDGPYPDCCPHKMVCDDD